MILFGHLGDGNVHVNVLGVDPGDERIDEAVLRLAAGAAGRSAPSTASAWRRRAGSASRAREAEIAAMRAIKRALDPEGILNPGAVLPAAAAPPA